MSNIILWFFLWLRVFWQWNFYDLTLFLKTVVAHLHTFISKENVYLFRGWSGKSILNHFYVTHTQTNIILFWRFLKILRATLYSIYVLYRVRRIVRIKNIKHTLWRYFTIQEQEGTFFITQSISLVKVLVNTWETKSWLRTPLMIWSMYSFLNELT